MSLIVPLMKVNRTALEVAAWVQQILQSQGFQVACTFDLQSALLGHGSRTCPHHRTTPCDCQAVILLVYGNGSQPVTIFIYGKGHSANLATENVADQGQQLAIFEALYSSAVVSNV